MAQPHAQRSRLQPFAALLGAAVIVVAVMLMGQAQGRAVGASADPAAIHLELVPVAAGFEQPIFVTGSGDGSETLYVVEQPGRIRVVAMDGTVAKESFLDISDAVVLEYEQGLLGLAFHPDYASNGRFYVDYTRAADGATVVSEFTAVGGAVDRDTERVILVVEQPFPNHNGGMIAFDASGFLLVGMGDGGSGGDPLDSGQDPTSLLGKLLRLDVDDGEPYAIPTDNGFVSDEAYRPEIHASGLRNPWRFSVDPVGGHVYIGDVGQEAWEEIDVLPEGKGGVSFGWNRLEGPECFSGDCDPAAHVAPAIAYGRDQGSTVIGGYVYRGTRQPLLDGIYLYGDYGSGTIWGASSDGLLDGSAEAVPLAVLDGTLVSFGTDDAGELYVVDQDGRILRVTAGAAP